MAIVALEKPSGYSGIGKPQWLWHWKTPVAIVALEKPRGYSGIEITQGLTHMD